MTALNKKAGLLKSLATVIRCIGAPNKFYRMKDIPSTYNQDGLITLCQNTEALYEKRFNDAWEASKELFPNDARPRWRSYVCCWAAEHALRLQGDFVECGVNRGGFSRAIAQYIDFNATGRDFYLFDTYCGLSEAHLSTGEDSLLEHHQKIYFDCYDEAKKTFSEYPRMHLIKGTVPETLKQVDIKSVAYLSIDMNCVMPEVEALRYFWDRLVPGALVVLDDYGWLPNHIQKKGIDALAKDLGFSVLTMPTGQGLIVR